MWVRFPLPAPAGARAQAQRADSPARYTGCNPVDEGSTPSRLSNRRATAGRHREAPRQRGAQASEKQAANAARTSERETHGQCDVHKRARSTAANATCTSERKAYGQCDMRERGQREGTRASEPLANASADKDEWTRYAGQLDHDGLVTLDSLIRSLHCVRFAGNPLRGAGRLGTTSA